MNQLRPNAVRRWKRLLSVWAAGCIGLASCSQQPYTDGERLYKTNCANCHMDDGRGLGALIPPLAGSDYLSAHREALPCIIRYGLSDTIVVNGRQFTEKMAGLPALSDVDITNLSNYVYTRWAAKRETYALEEVQQLLEKCRQAAE